MPKVSVHGGGSDVNAESGSVLADAAGRYSSAHPDEQGIVPLYGEPTDTAEDVENRKTDAELAEEDEWHGSSSTQSPERPKLTKTGTKTTRQ